MKTTRLLIAVAALVLASAGAQAQGLRGLGNTLKKATETVKESAPASQPAAQPGNEPATTQQAATTETDQQAAQEVSTKPSEKALAADPKASDQTIAKGFTRSLSEIRARFEQLPDKVYYKPYYAEECHYFYPLGDDQERLYEGEMDHVQMAYHITRKVGHMRDGLKVEYRKYIKVKTPAYRENPAREGYVIIGQHAVHAYFAQFAADPVGSVPYWDFVSARMIQTAFGSFDAAAWVTENGQQSQTAIILEDGSKAKLVESLHLWKDKMSEEEYRLRMLLYEQTPYNVVAGSAIHVLTQMRAAKDKNDIPALRTHFHRYEIMIDDMKNHPKHPEDEVYFTLLREHKAYEEEYEEWVSMAQMSGPPVEMPQTYDMGAGLAAKALETAKSQFSSSFEVDKVVFLSNSWEEFKEPNYPYRVMHRSLVAGLLTRHGDKWVIRRYNFSQHSDKQGGWIEHYQFTAGFDGLYEPRPVNYKP